jgi:hypothetical protein
MFTTTLYRRPLFLALAALTGLAVLAPISRAATNPNALVLRFALANKGRQVGDGICNTLVLQALNYAGAQPGHASGNTWVYGRRLGGGDVIAPGDVLLFTNVTFKDGSSFPYHGAIVGRAVGTTVLVAHQNFGGKKFVQLTWLDMSTRTQGQLDYYRPLSRSRTQTKTVRQAPRQPRARVSQRTVRTPTRVKSFRMVRRPVSQGHTKGRAARPQTRRTGQGSTIRMVIRVHGKSKQTGRRTTSHRTHRPRQRLRS